MKFKDKYGRDWEVFVDRWYYDSVCVRLIENRDFNSKISFHFDTQQQADNFVELLKQAN